MKNDEVLEIKINCKKQKQKHLNSSGLLSKRDESKKKTLKLRYDYS